MLTRLKWLRHEVLERGFFLRERERCWEWPWSRNRCGYGQLYDPVSNRAQPAHRMAYLLARGRIPDRLQCDHLCRNKACFNPWHIELVTPSENTKRGLAGIS